jgi:dihydroorotate dehydrogenase/Pyruvate/2-oxoacid:ferredoxin oxidoreductase delta subunit
MNEVGELDFSNCIIALSGSPLSKGNEIAIKAGIRAGIGGITCKTVSSEGGQGFGRNSMRELTEYGLPFSLLVTGQWVTEVLNLTEGSKIIKLTKRLRGNRKNLPVVASILEPTLDAEKWASTAAFIERSTNCDAIELNLGKWLPKYYKRLEANLNGDIDERIRCVQELQMECYKKHVEIAKEVKQRVSIPVLVKLGHGARYTDLIAEALIKEKIPLTLLNAPKAEVVSDSLSPFRPIHIGMHGFKQGVITGAVLYEMHLTFNTELLKKTSYRAEIIHSGGIVTVGQAVQALIKGEQLVGICTGLFLKGINFIKELEQGVTQFARKFNAVHVKDLQDRFKWQRELDEFERFQSASPILNRQLCTSCLKCIEVCPDGSIKKEDGRIKFRQYCQGCGACVRVCKNNAIKIMYSSDITFN